VGGRIDKRKMLRIYFYSADNFLHQWHALV
jgi:hypothetical protein